jgi:peptide/nickel transport system substrate-binding protein
VKKVFILPLVLLLVCAFILSGCSSSSTTTAPSTTAASNPTTKPAATTAASNPTTKPAATTPATKKYGGTMRFIQTTGNTTPGGWPADMTMDSSPVYESLVTQELNGDIGPRLATSFEIAPDRSSVTFKLRNDVKFTDGSDFNAAEVKFVYDAQIAGKKATNWASVEIIDDYTVKVNIIKWTTTTMASFSDTSNTSGIPSKVAFEKNGIDWMRQNPTGTGAFKFSSFTRDESYKLVKNPNYWQTGKPYVDEYQMITITDEMTQKTAMQAGEGDATVCELGKQTDDFKRMGLEIASQVQVVFSLIPDTGNADSPWSKQQVREAAEYAIDKDSIATGFGYGMWKAPYQVVPRGYGPYNNDFSGGRKYDPARAKSLLAEAGYPAGFKTTMIPFPGATSKDVAQAVQKYLGNVGIEVEIQYMDYGKYATIRDGGWTNGFFLDPVPAYANYMQSLGFLFNPKGWIWYKSWERTPEYIALFDAANATLNPDNALIRKVTQQMYDKATVIPVYEGGKSYAYQKYVKDAGFLTRGFALFWNTQNVWLDK